MDTISAQTNDGAWRASSLLFSINPIEVLTAMATVKGFAPAILFIGIRGNEVK